MVLENEASIADKLVRAAKPNNMKVLTFTMVYDVYTPNSNEPPERMVNHVNIGGLVHDNGEIEYPSIDNVKSFLKTVVITKHAFKKFLIDESRFSVLSPVTYTYKQHDFKELPVILPGEPEELIMAIKDYVASRAMGSATVKEG